ncbi:hypothetical protein [Deinococcus aquatilis]|uniref:hypothetical protein n=1 Tax=Deinococcus aquatilis TaxID=519440 RepID=UPI003CCBCAFB
MVDSAWQRRGTSWLWDAQARNLVCKPQEVVSVRQFLQLTHGWPDDLPSNGNNVLVVAGLDGCLDLLTPDHAVQWLRDTVKHAVLSFQTAYDGQAALVFWLPDGERRLEINSTTDAVIWRCAGSFRDQRIDFGRVLWGEAREYPRELILALESKPVGLYHLRIT